MRLLHVAVAFAQQWSSNSPGGNLVTYLIVSIITDKMELLVLLKKLAHGLIGKQDDLF